MDFSRAINLNPQDPEAYRLRAEAYKRQGDTNNSDSDLAQANRIEETIVSQAREQQAQAEAQRLQSTAQKQQQSSKTNDAATVSLVFGILAWVGLPVIGALIAVIAGHRALNAIQMSGGVRGGRTQALIGLGSGYVQFVLTGLIIIFLLLR
jgi:hypothetical protein